MGDTEWLIYMYIPVVITNLGLKLDILCSFHLSQMVFGGDYTKFSNAGCISKHRGVTPSTYCDISGARKVKQGRALGVALVPECNYTAQLP